MLRDISLEMSGTSDNGAEMSLETSGISDNGAETYVGYSRNSRLSSVAQIHLGEFIVQEQRCSETS